MALRCVWMFSPHIHLLLRCLPFIGAVVMFGMSAAIPWARTTFTMMTARARAWRFVIISRHGILPLFVTLPRLRLLVMSKGMWHLIAYPESMKPLEDVLNVLRGSGAKVAYVLHDKDWYTEDIIRNGTKVHSKGDIKKAHYHFLCGWSRGFPDWDTLHDICAECQIPVGKYRDVKVQDEDESLDYLTHPEEKYPDKYHYSPEEVHIDSGFDPDAYITAAKRRKLESKAAAGEKNADFSALFEVVRKSGIDEWHELLDMLADSRPDMVETLLLNAYPIKAYLDSKRNAFATRKRFESKIQQYVDRAERAEKLVTEISLERDALARDNDALRNNINVLLTRYGEPPIADWEIDVK